MDLKINVRFMVYLKYILLFLLISFLSVFLLFLKKNPSNYEILFGLLSFFLAIYSLYCIVRLIQNKYAINGNEKQINFYPLFGKNITFITEEIEFIIAQNTSGSNEVTLLKIKKINTTDTIRFDFKYLVADQDELNDQLIKFMGQIKKDNFLFKDKESFNMIYDPEKNKPFFQKKNFYSKNRNMIHVLFLIILLLIMFGPLAFKK